MHGRECVTVIGLDSNKALTLGIRDQAFLWLDRAFDDRDPSLVAVHVHDAFRTHLQGMS